MSDGKEKENLRQTKTPSVRDRDRSPCPLPPTGADVVRRFRKEQDRRAGADSC